MAQKRKKSKTFKAVKTIRHADDKRKNIPTAEHQSVLEKAHAEAKPLRYPRNTDLDPQLVWRGKDEQDWSDLVVHAPPLYIQEKVHPKVLIDDLLRQTKEARAQQPGAQFDLFADFNGIPEGVDKTEFYQHDQNWSNRMILGDSLQVMASLAEREGLRGQVQCIYVDPPYGIKFNSNFQWSTTSRDVKDGKANHITREPEQVKAFRDTWRHGIHSYLTYLRDRLTVARELLCESGSIFVQIGDENVHRVRSLMDEVFGDDCFLSEINVVKTSGLAASGRLRASTDTILWYGKAPAVAKYRPLLLAKSIDGAAGALYRYVRDGAGVSRRLSSSESAHPDSAFTLDNLTKPGPGRRYRVSFEGRGYHPGARWWGLTESGISRVMKAGRLAPSGNTIRYFRAWKDYAVLPLNNLWTDTGTGGFLEPKVYVVQTTEKIVQRCLLMATDPGDLVLDPTCGSGTTAMVAEQWGRRWITIDTSRVALTLARARIMGARYPYYLLLDSDEGKRREAEVTRRAPSTSPSYGNIRHGFVYERVPHITLKSIANNAEIDVIWGTYEARLTRILEELTSTIGDDWIASFRNGRGYDLDIPDTIQEWEVPRGLLEAWPDGARPLHEAFWKLRAARQREMDASIAARTEYEFLYDKPYEDKKTVRVAGPFTVESLSPHRVLAVDEDDDLVDPQEVKDRGVGYGTLPRFDQMVLENLRTAGVQQAHKEDKIVFRSLIGWPGTYICAEGRYQEGDGEKRAGVFIGPEFGTVSRPDLVEAAREAGDAGFDVLIACAFNYEAHASEFHKLGRIPVLKARMNADLHMAADLKATGKGNLFVIFGEPDIEILDAKEGMIAVKVNGVDVFDPTTGEIRSDSTDGIACWFIDSDYNGESFFVRHAYFLGASDPYQSLKTTLKAEIDAEAWASLHSDTSRPFPRPGSGRIAVKVINHLGDEVMKVFKV